MYYVTLHYVEVLRELTKNLLSALLTITVRI